MDEKRKTVTFISQICGFTISVDISVPKNMPWDRVHYVPTWAQIKSSMEEAWRKRMEKDEIMLKMKVWDKECARKIKEEPGFLDKPFFGIHSPEKPTSDLNIVDLSQPLNFVDIECFSCHLNFFYFGPDNKVPTEYICRDCLNREIYENHLSSIHSQ